MCNHSSCLTPETCSFCKGLKPLSERIKQEAAPKRKSRGCNHYRGPAKQEFCGQEVRGVERINLKGPNAIGQRLAAGFAMMEWGNDNNQ